MGGERGSKISIVTLTSNSETHIRTCLESAKWADEIIIVDSLSSDKTVEIAKEYTGKIWQRPWPGYAAQWNFAIEKASGDWILILASDEAITYELRNEIIGALANESDVGGYFVPRKTYFLDKWIRHCGWYPDYSIRLIRRGSGKFDESALLHEALKVNGRTAHLKEAISHYSFPTISAYIDRMNRYTTLAAQQMVRDGLPIETGNMRNLATGKALKTFWKMFVMQQGYRDGMRGLFVCLFSSVYQMMRYAKYWEIKCA